jgi:ATP-dependent DNA helicase RecQ
VIAQPVNRPNIAFDLIPVANKAQKREEVLEAVRRLNGPGIVYCRTRQAVEQLTAFCLETGAARAHGYHAGMASLERVLVQEQFLSGELDVIFATNAFGMGIDKPDIRFVLHYHYPASLEEYTQEVGRIGRDGEPGYACLYVMPEDAAIHQHMLVREYPTAEEISRFCAILANHSGCVIAQELAAYTGVEEDMLDVLFFYAEAVGYISQVFRGKDQFRYRLHELSHAAAAKRMEGHIDKIRQIKWRKLQHMQMWMGKKGCLRRGLSTYFDGIGSFDHDLYCCVHCGIERGAYFQKEPKTKIRVQEEWNLEQALSVLLPIRNRQGAYES